MDRAIANLKSLIIQFGNNLDLSNTSSEQLQTLSFSQPLHQAFFLQLKPQTNKTENNFNFQSLRTSNDRFSNGTDKKLKWQWQAEKTGNDMTSCKNLKVIVKMLRFADASLKSRVIFSLKTPQVISYLTMQTRLDHKKLPDIAHLARFVTAPARHNRVPNKILARSVSLTISSSSLKIQTTPNKTYAGLKSMLQEFVTYFPLVAPLVQIKLCGYQT